MRRLDCQQSRRTREIYVLLGELMLRKVTRYCRSTDARQSTYSTPHTKRRFAHATKHRTHAHTRALCDYCSPGAPANTSCDTANTSCERHKFSRNAGQELTADEVEKHNHRRHAEPVEERRRHGAKPHPGFHAQNRNEAKCNDVDSERLKVRNLSIRIE